MTPKASVAWKRIIGGSVLAAGLFGSAPGFAQERYAGVTLAPQGWQMREMQTFSGSVPSRAWVFGRGDEEAVVSVLVTEGITGGLKDQDYGKLAKLYLDALIGGWGGKADAEKKGDAHAPFCGDAPGYQTTGTFGTIQQSYFACLRIREDLQRIVTVVTWLKMDESVSVAAQRLQQIQNDIDMTLSTSE